MKLKRICPRGDLSCAVGYPGRGGSALQGDRCI